MFQPVPRQPSMIDPVRGYSWRSLGMADRGQIVISAITIDGQEIPYEYRVQHHHDGGDEWYEIELGAFGGSIVGALRWGLGRAAFDSDTDLEAAILIAIEATLAWEPAGYALERGDGYYRIKRRGVEYRLSDFGPYFEQSPV